jgi:hypothetical protein
MEMNMRPWKLTLDIDATHKYDGENSGTKVAYFVDTMASKAWCQTITSYNINVVRKYGYQQNYDDAFKRYEIVINGEFLDKALEQCRAIMRSLSVVSYLNYCQVEREYHNGEVRRPKSKTWGGEQRRSNRQQQKRRLRDGDYDI